MSTRRILQVINALFFALVIGTPLFYFKWSIYPYIVPKSAFLQIIVEILFFLWLALAIKDKRYRPRMTPLAWGVAMYLAILTVTALTGVDFWRSFFSSQERAYGLLLIYHLAAFALVASALAREIPWKKLWYASFTTSLIAIGIALLQLKVPNLLLIEAVIDRPGATFGNPTFLAGYLLLTVFAAAYYFSRAPAARRGEQAFLVAVLTVNVAGVFLTQTRGDILGFLTGVLVFVAAFVIWPPEARSKFFASRALYAGTLVVLIAASVGMWLTRTNPVWSHVPGLDRLKAVSLSGQGSPDIAPRLIAFREAWEGFRARPLTGWGLENFNAVFSKYYDPHALEYGYAETDFDKPHSVPLEELVSGGIGLFLAYYAVLALFICEAWKTKDRPLFRAMIALVAAYAVRSLVIFDTLGPVLVLYLLFGFVDGKAYGAPDPPREEKRRGAALPDGGATVHPGLVLALLVPAAALIWAFNATTLYASYYSYVAHLELQVYGNIPAAMADFRSDVDTWNPYQWEFVRDYANTIAQAYFYDHAIPKSDILYAIEKMKQVAADHPNDAYNHYLLTDIYNLVADINPTEYLPAAEKEAAIAFQLSPDRQEIYFYLAKTKSLEGDNAAAFDLAKKAVDLDPKVPDSHFYYGMLAFATGKNDLGMSEVKAAIALGRVWRNFYEPRVAADYFADAGDLPEAIALYRTALALQPGDLEAEIKLGAAYFISGQPDLARPFLRDAASRFDFTKSAQYPQYKPILDALGIPAGPARVSP